MGSAAGEASSRHDHIDPYREERTDIDSTAGLPAHTLATVFAENTKQIHTVFGMSM